MSSFSTAVIFLIALPLLFSFSPLTNFTCDLKLQSSLPVTLFPITLLSFPFDPLPLLPHAPYPFLCFQFLSDPVSFSLCPCFPATSFFVTLSLPHFHFLLSPFPCYLATLPRSPVTTSFVTSFPC